MLDRFLRGFAYAGGAGVLFLMLLTLFDIVTRHVLAMPFLGAFELTELTMALIVALGLPYCAAVGGHVAVDLLGRWLDRPGLAWLGIALHVLGAALMAVIAWRMVLYAMASITRGEATNMLKTPVAPFQLTLAASCAIFAIVLLREAWRARR